MAHKRTTLKTSPFLHIDSLPHTVLIRLNIRLFVVMLCLVFTDFLTFSLFFFYSLRIRYYIFLYIGYIVMFV